MGIVSSAFDVTCGGRKMEDIDIDSGVHVAPHTRQRLNSRDLQNHQSLWFSAIDEGNANPNEIKQLAETMFADSEENIVETLFPNGTRATHRAVECDNLPLVAYLANSLNCNIDSPNANTGDTPLILAVQNGNVEIVQFLLGLPTSSGKLERTGIANIQLCNADGETAMDFAQLDENAELLKLLFEANHEGGDERSSSASDLQTVEEEGGEPPLVTSPSAERQGEPEGTTNITLDESIVPREMTGWLQKRRFKENRKLNLGSSTWSDRFVVLRDGWMCWGARAVEGVESLDDPAAREGFNQAWNVRVLDGVVATKSKAHRNFKIEISESSIRDHRMYEFKARTEEERDEWIQNIHAWVRDASEEEV